MLPRRIALHAGLVAAALLAVWAVGRSTRVASRAEEHARIAEERETVAVTAYHKTRDSIPVLQAARDRAERALRALRATAATTLARTETVTVASRAVLADTAATVLQLRGALYVQTATTERVAAEFRDYLASDAVAHEAMTAERVVLLSALRKADTALAASQRVGAAWQQAATCRVLGVRCPTRTQAFLGGVIVTAALALR